MVGLQNVKHLASRVANLCDVSYEGLEQRKNFHRESRVSLGLKLLGPHVARKRFCEIRQGKRNEHKLYILRQLSDVHDRNR